jgi:hypothetical protein
MTRYAYYICPLCGRHTAEMDVAPEQYQPTDEQRRREPAIAYEILLCPCGARLTWFTVKPIMTTVEA